jgi:hypothetical protein
MIPASDCVQCHTAAQETQPIGWTRVVVTAATRVEDTSEGKRELQTRRQEFYMCEKCFPDWWKGKEG